MTRTRTAAAVVAVLSFASFDARADDSDADAERLFHEAQKLLEDRRYGEACPKFETAYKKDGKLGTLLNLAYCHKEQGSLWYAWLEFREAEFKADEQKRPERKDFARKRLDEIEKDKTLAKVIIENPAKVPLTEIDVEDRKVPEAERGAYFIAEEGKRKFTFKAKGKKPATSLVTIVRGERPQKVVVPELEDQPVEPPPPPPPTGDRVEPPPKQPEQEKSDGSTQRILGWTGMGVGVAAAAVGGVFGIMTLDNPCAKNGSGDKVTCAPGSSENNKKDTTGTLSTILIPAGGALFIGGLVLLLTAPSSSDTKSAIAPEIGLGYYGVRGTF